MKHLFLLLPLAAVLFFSACNNNDDEGQAGKADLELSFEPISEKPDIGEEVTFQLNLYNRGPLAANGIVVENEVPSGYEIAGVGSGGTASGKTLRWEGLAANPEETLSLTFTALAGKALSDTAYTHRAQVVSGNPSDPDSSPNNRSGNAKEDDEADLFLAPRAALVHLNFKAFYGADPLVMFEREYDYEDGMALKMQLFQFYLSDVRLLRGDESVPLMDVELVSFGDVYSDQDAGEGQSTATAVVPPGDYTGIEFGFGLTPELNATIPPDYPLGHPLSENYWEAAGSYIFFKFEGNADLQPNGDFSDKLTFHVGGNDNFRRLVFNKPATLEEDKEQALQFNIDLQKMLVDQASGEYLDFRQVQQSHSNSSPSATFMADHVQEAITME